MRIGRPHVTGTRRGTVRRAPAALVAALALGTAVAALGQDPFAVAVSQDGLHFLTFPYDPNTHVGLAGQAPVLSNPDNGISPLDPSVSGGDHFDLADVGLTWAAYVRVTDPGLSIDDPGNHLPPGT